MVSVLSRPEGYILGPGISAKIEEDYAPYATVDTTTPHGLTTGTVVYIASNAEEYNGFWPIEVLNAINFWLVNGDGTRVVHTVDISLTYYVSQYAHGWNCAHLPIVYRLSNNRYPTNSVYASRTIFSITNANGFSLLTTFLSLGSFEDLAWVKISGAADDRVNGVWQVMDKHAANEAVLNLVYSNYDLTGAAAQLMDANYNIVVRIYGGIPNDNPVKGYHAERLMATMRFIPDSDNEIKFSIAEVIKGDLCIRNNIQLSALPNNTDFWTGFRIEYAESYDTSNGYTIQTFTSSFTADSFQGYGANSVLPFRNRQSGSLSEYIMNSVTAKFLTIFSIPVFFAGCDCYIDDVVAIQPTLQQPIGDWVNLAAGGVNWSLGNPADIILDNGESSNYLKGTLSNASPGYYTFPVNIKSNSGSLPVQISIALLTSANVVIKTKTITATITNTLSLQSITIPSGNAEATPAYVGVKVTNLGSSDIITINSVTLEVFSPLKNINPDGPCYQDLSFILNFDNPSIPGITDFVDIGPAGNNPMTGDPYPDKPWTKGTDDYHIALATGLDPSNNIAADILNPPGDLVYKFRVSVHGSVSGGGGITGEFLLDLRDKSSPSLTKGTVNVNIPNGMGLSSYPITINATGFADQVRVRVFNDTGSTNTLTVTMVRMDYQSSDVSLLLKKVYSDKTDSDDISFKGIGLYRAPLNLDRGYTSVAVHLELNGVSISETKTIEINSDCANQVLKMTWVNNLGGFDYWNFTAKKDFETEIIDTGETSANLLPSWPNSYGEFADTSDRRQTYRDSVDDILIRSQNLSLDNVNAIRTIRKSILAQIINGRQDRRTVVIDSESFTAYREEDKLYTASFKAKMTDNNPSQRI